MRLDLELVARGLAASRSQARDLVLRGLVHLNGAPARRPAQSVLPADRLELVAGAGGRVSRGGEKLAAALDTFGFDARGVTALDVGASTGGFTEELLARGAATVYAVDVGRGQLHPRLADDRRVVLLEATDARVLNREVIPARIDAITADVSFISLTKALPAALALAAPGAWLAALVKPQFEAGRENIAKGGIVRSEAARQAALEAVATWLAALPGWRVIGTCPSPIPGGSGNHEYLIGARLDS